MENNSTFSYEYSAKQQEEVESIRRKYLPEEESKLTRLKRLDSKAQSAGMLESLSLGIVGALLFGVGMCFGLGALTGASWLAYAFGIAGIITMLPAHSLYRHISAKTRESLTPEILSLSQELMDEGN